MFDSSTHGVRIDFFSLVFFSSLIWIFWSNKQANISFRLWTINNANDGGRWKREHTQRPLWTFKRCTISLVHVRENVGVAAQGHKYMLFYTFLMNFNRLHKFAALKKYCIAVDLGLCTSANDEKWCIDPCLQKKQRTAGIIHPVDRI